MAKRVKAISGRRILRVVIFHQANGVQLPVIEAYIPGRKKPINFIMTPDAAADHGRTIMDAAGQCKRWNTLPVTKRLN